MMTTEEAMESTKSRQTTSGKPLWPEPGFSVRAFEKRLGEGRITVTQQSFMFEQANGGDVVGFDLSTLRLVRVPRLPDSAGDRLVFVEFKPEDPYNFDVMWSVGGEIRNASFRVVCTGGASGEEFDHVPEEEAYDDDSVPEEKKPMDASGPGLQNYIRLISGGVVARFLSDHSKARTEGLVKMSDEEFDAKIAKLREYLDDYPTQEEYLGGSYDPDPVMEQKWEKYQRAASGPIKLFIKLFIDLSRDWIRGKLSPEQRLQMAIMGYKEPMRSYELRHSLWKGDDPDEYKTVAQSGLDVELKLGIDILRYV